MNMFNKILLLVDYRNYFYMSSRNKDSSMDVDQIIKYFNDNGYTIAVKNFYEIDFKNNNYMGYYILYHSTEDRNLFYKSYIEDILLGLQIQGAILIPDFIYFRAHHNKVFMEILRDLCKDTTIKKINSKYFGSFEDFFNSKFVFTKPMVVKPSEGATSRGVKLTLNQNELVNAAKKVSKSINIVDLTKNYIKSIIRSYHVKTSNHRKKFLFQEFIPGLDFDYKILIYGNKYYVLKRMTRKNDFRASGSGLFEWPENVSPELLNYASHIYNEFDVPFISIDIGSDGSAYYIFEFQFVSFGNLTLEKSNFYFEKHADQWTKINKRSSLENEFVNSITQYIKRKYV
jgi:hypothetical protein